MKNKKCNCGNFRKKEHQDNDYKYCCNCGGENHITKEEQIEKNEKQTKKIQGEIFNINPFVHDLF